MSSVVDLAISVLDQAERRVEIAAQNLANATTPAYKRKVAFSAAVSLPDRPDISLPQVAAVTDFRTGKLSTTGNPTDIAIAGRGYFAVRRDDAVIYTRQGRFTLDRDGRLTTSNGFALQLLDGGDLVVKSSDFRVDPDGSVFAGKELLGRIAVYRASDEARLEPVNGGFRNAASELAPADDAIVRQGAFEASNVSTGDEMVSMIEALRRAESGQRVMNVYDDLMGRVITTFGESVR